MRATPLCMHFLWQHNGVVVGGFCSKGWVRLLGFTLLVVGLWLPVQVKSAALPFCQVACLAQKLISLEHGR